MPEPTQARQAPTSTPQAPVAGDARTAPTADQVYRAKVSQREVLGDQMSEANQLRRELVSQLSSPAQSAATKASLEKRIASVDQHIADLDQQLAKSDLEVSQAAAVPGAIVHTPRPPQTQPDPDMLAGLTFTLMFVIAIPITIAFARRIWRKSARTEVTLPAEMSARMESLERGVEAIALEVERIGEGQRFVTQALAQRGDIRAVGAGAAEPVAVRKAERIEDRR